MLSLPKGLSIGNVRSLDKTHMGKYAERYASYWDGSHPSREGAGGKKVEFGEEDGDKLKTFKETYLPQLAI